MTIKINTVDFMDYFAIKLFSVGFIFDYLMILDVLLTVYDLDRYCLAIDFSKSGKTY